MWIFRILIGTLYDIGQAMAALSALAGLGYFVVSLVMDSQVYFFTSLKHFALALIFWLIARLFRRYAT
ncbi:MAG: hypothetical protein WAT81_05695 [Candidatus Moraniibacteriota bacterium]